MRASARVDHGGRGLEPIADAAYRIGTRDRPRERHCLLMEDGRPSSRHADDRVVAVITDDLHRLVESRGQPIVFAERDDASRLVDPERLWEFPGRDTLEKSVRDPSVEAGGVVESRLDHGDRAIVHPAIVGR